MKSPSYPGTRQMVDALQEEGRYTFTLQELRARVPGSEVALQASLRRLKARGRLFRPRRAFYVIVPLEYRKVGAPPASWFIDQLMRSLHRPYYVGLLTAAAQHGASHQSPQVFQVLTTVPMRPVRAARIGISFYAGKRTEVTPAIEVNTPTGTMRVSTPEVTVLDLVRRPAAGGYLSNVATVIAELAEQVDGQKLRSAAKLYRSTDLKRLGYILEFTGRGELADLLADLLPTRRKQLTPLRPGHSGRVFESSSRWGLAINEKIETDP
jgi:predicted transcriptional regulator of viral defense system